METIKQLQALVQNACWIDRNTEFICIEDHPSVHEVNVVLCFDNNCQFCINYSYQDLQALVVDGYYKVIENLLDSIEYAREILDLRGAGVEI